MFNSLRPHGLQLSRLPCPSPTPGACSNSCSSSWWCHPTISSCHPILLPPSVFPSIRVLSSQSVLPIKWPKHWTFSFSISPSNEYSGLISFQFSSVQSLSHVWLSATPWMSARQASLSITSSQSSLRLTFIEKVMPSSHLILCRPLLLLPPIPLSIRVFSNESTLRVRWPKYWSFSFSIIPSKVYDIYLSFPDLLHAE